MSSIRRLHSSSTKEIISVCVRALLQGSVVAYPTDTSYGLAVDATNAQAVAKLYRVKGRSFRKPVHVVVSSISAAKKMVLWNKTASALSTAFWPGALTIVLPASKRAFGTLTAGTGFLGVRMPNNEIALALAKKLGRPITATSANVSKKPDCYTVSEIVAQYAGRRNKPDIIIDSGSLRKRKPSTVVKISGKRIEVLRVGPVSKKQIENIVTAHVI